jgi:hypothetical protein
MKRNLLLFIIALCPLVFFSCARSGDILLSYSNGSISRKEFYDWLSFNHYDLSNVIKKKDQQKPKLTAMAIEKIACKEAADSGFDKNPGSLITVDVSRKRLISQKFLEEKVFADTKITEPVIITDSLFFRNKSGILNKKDGDLVSSTLSDLQKGAAFSEVARKYANNLSVTKGTLIITRVHPMIEYRTAAMLLKKGEYTKKPVVTQAGTYLIYARDIRNVSFPDTIAKKKHDEEIPYSLAASLIREKTKEQLTASLSSKTEKSVILKYSPAADKRTVLFSINGEQTTIADFDEIFSAFSANLHLNTNDQIEAKNKFLKDLYEIDLIYNEAVKLNYINKNIIENENHLRNSIIARNYITSIAEKNTVVSDADVKKEMSFLSDKKINPRNTRKPESAEVIKKRLFDRAVAESIAKWRESKIKEYRLSIHERALAGN